MSLNKFNEVNKKEMINLLQEQLEKEDNKDLEQIEKLKNEIKKYDIYDFLAGISALNLIPNNQSKSVIFNCIISATLSIPLSDVDFSNKMSINKFKQIVKTFENLSIKRIIDPPEFPFVQNLIYYKNYCVFMGVSNICIEDIQTLLNVIRDNYEKLSPKILNKINTVILAMLEFSTSISKKINYTTDTLEKSLYDDEIVIPSKQEFERLKTLVEIDMENLEKFCYDSEEFDDLFCDLNCCTENDYLDFDHQYYYSHPLLKINGNNILLLDISIFPILLMHKIVKNILTDEIGCELLKEYNKYAWKETRKYFALLNCHKINESSAEIDLIEDDNYKERLLNLGNDSVIINIGFFDTGEHYDNEKLVSYYSLAVTNEFVNERLNYIIDKLVKKGTKKENIYIIFTPTEIGRIFYKEINNVPCEKLVLRNYEIKTIAINESDQNLFLKRYIIAKKKLKRFIPNAFSELNLVAMYVSKDYSFYFNDDIDIKETMLCYTGEFSAEYILKANKKIDEHLVESYEDDYNCVVIKNERNTYICKGFTDKRLNICVETNGFLFWIITEVLSNSETLPLYKNIIDFLSYWIDEYFSIYDNNKLSKIVIELKLQGKIEDYYKKIDIDKPYEEIINIINNENGKYIFEFFPEFNSFIDCKDNTNEKKLFEYILKRLSDINKVELIISEYIDLIFKNPDKKRAVTLNYGKFSYLKPFSSSQQRIISASDENIILDDLGLYAKNELGISYGELNNNQKDELPKKIVDKLYSDILNEMKKYDKYETIKLLYYESERILSNLMIQKESYINNVACYPEKKFNIDKIYNDLSKVSLAIKFIIELFVSFEDTGTERMNEYEFELILAKSSQLIEWAYKNDLYHYNIINIPINLLKSNRIGMNQERLIETSMAFNRLREEQMGSIGKNKMKLLMDGFVKEQLDNNEFENIFIKEFCFSTKSLFELFWYLIDKGEETENEIFEIKLETLKQELSSKISSTELERLLDYLSLPTRQDFLKPPTPHRKEDVYPWRFNRILSFIRKPIIIYKNKVIWGNRNLSNSIFYLFDLINDGRLKATSKDMKDYITKINTLRGRNFNNLVYKYISDIENLIVDKNVSKINGIEIADEEKLTLGDIDVLYISVTKRKIVLVETKNFNSVKNYYELYNEYTNLFVDTEDKRSFLTKHKRRVNWIKENINEVKKHYSLPDLNFKVYYMFVTSEYCTANEVFKMKENIYSIKELNEKILLNIK